MSYSGVGSYYTFSPHQVYSGYGSYYEYSGFGSVADTFDPDAVMADIATSDICYGPGGKGAADPQAGKCNFAGQRANKEIAAALNSLGYGPIAVDGSISWQGAYARFLADNGLTKGPGFGITRQALLTMQARLKAGETPGGNPVEFEKVNGEYVPTGKTAGAGLGAGTWILAALAVGVVGYAAFAAGKKKKGAPTSSSTAMTTTMR